MIVCSAHFRAMRACSSAYFCASVLMAPFSGHHLPPWQRKRVRIFYAPAPRGWTMWAFSEREQCDMMPLRVCRLGALLLLLNVRLQSYPASNFLGRGCYVIVVALP
eukprot:6183243-Pleurochrysis_carterae.AAC.1